MKKWMLMGLCIVLSSFLSAQSITEMEYFFDSDPGIGNGFSLSVSAADTVNPTFTLATNTLAAGFHTLYIRAKDLNGEWSLYSGGTFHILENNTQQAAPMLTEVEYFIDADPGIGNGTAISSSLTDTIEQSNTLLLNGLSPGPHQLSMRAKDQDGKWGLYQSRVFWVVDSTTLGDASGLTTSEYFYDSDLGIANGTLISTPQTDTLDTTVSLATDGLTTGFHRLLVREKNLDDTWGQYVGGMFYIADSTQAGEAPQLIGLEYFYGADPGTGNGTYMSFPPADSINTWFSFGTTGLGIGTHILSVRVKDAQNVWSMILQDSIEIQAGCGISPTVTATGPLAFCQGEDSVLLSTDPFYASYLWSNGATTSEIWVANSGSYSVSVVDTAGCAGTSFPITVTASEINGFIFLDGLDAFCEGTSTDLFTNVPYTNYLWTNGDTSPTTTITETGSYNVMVTNSEGCTDTLNPVFLQEVPQPPQPMVEQIAPDSLRSSLVGTSYIWYKDFTQLPQTTRVIYAAQSGTYQVSILNQQECQSDKSDMYDFTATSIEEDLATESLLIYPNPTSGSFTVEWETRNTQVMELRVLNTLGQEVWKKHLDAHTGTHRESVSLADQAAGMYSLILTSPNGHIRRTILLK